MMHFPQFVALLVCTLLSAGGAANAEQGQGAPETRVLRVNEPKQGETIRIDQDTVKYVVEGLQAGVSYEARLSFPITNPARINFWLEGEHVAPIIRRSARRLLDAEKVSFRTDGQARMIIDGHGRADGVVMLRAERWALHVGGKASQPPVLVYDIVLERNVLGIPFSAGPLLIAIAVLVVLAFLLAPVWQRRAVPALMQWLVGGQEQRKWERGD